MKNIDFNDGLNEEYEEENNINLGDAIKFYRELRGLTQEQLAKGVCNRSTISLIESNEIKSPRIDVLNKICNHLMITVEELYTFALNGCRKNLNSRRLAIAGYIDKGDFGTATSLAKESSKESSYTIDRRTMLYALASEARSKFEGISKTKTYLEEAISKNKSICTVAEAQIGIKYVQSCMEERRKCGHESNILPEDVDNILRKVCDFVIFSKITEEVSRLIKLQLTVADVLRYLDRIDQAEEILNMANYNFVHYNNVEQFGYYHFINSGFQFDAGEYERAEDSLEKSLNFYKATNNMELYSYVKKYYINQKKRLAKIQKKQ